jgi:mono/diheme cytochrome c family protein
MTILPGFRLERCVQDHDPIGWVHTGSGSIAMNDLDDMREAGARECLDRFVRRAVLGVGIALTFSASVLAQDAARVAAGENAWGKAGCFQCHGAAGEGGDGGEFPAGPSLRETKLERTALAETISCGRPGTRMPAWLDGAYTETRCYGLPKGPAPAGLDRSPVLSADEVQALLDYLTAKIIRR